MRVLRVESGEWSFSFLCLALIWSFQVARVPSRALNPLTGRVFSGQGAVNSFLKCAATKPPLPRGGAAEGGGGVHGRSKVKHTGELVRFFNCAAINRPRSTPRVYGGLKKIVFARLFFK